MHKFLIVLVILNFHSPVFSSAKDKIIFKLEQTNNLSFNFIQNISEKKERGRCIIKYPKKIYCEYDNINKKIIVSNGKSLVIKNRNSGNYSIYPLKRTPLELLLDKNYLISKISALKPKNVDNKFLSFRFFQNNNEINIFFDKTNFYLVGWQTEDVYQNLSITYISSIKINQELNDKIFLLPKNDY